MPDSRLDDTIATYSSKGPTIRDQIAKPDLVAPGNQLVARTLFGTGLPVHYSGNKVTFAGSTEFFRLSGTGMAAPVVAGAAALLLQKEPALTPDQVKARLMKTAWKGFLATASILDLATGLTFNVQHDLFTVGAGLLDINAALISTENIGATQRALSPRAVVSNGKIVLTTDYSFIGVTNIVWGTSVVWGEASTAGYNGVWGDNIVWGEASMFPLSRSLAGDN